MRNRIVSRPRRKGRISPSRAWVCKIVAVSVASLPGIGRDQPGKVRVHQGNHWSCTPAGRRQGEELFTGDNVDQVQRVVVRQQADHVVAGVEDQLRIASRSGDGWLSSAVASYVRVKLCVPIKSAIHWAQASV